MKKILLISFMLVILSGCTLNKQTSTDAKNANTKKTISTEELKTEIENLTKIDAKKVNENDYPKILGVYAENGLTLIESYHCSDVCPDYAGLNIIYDNVKSKEDCTKIGGISLIDPAWRTYRGCAPKID